MARTGRPPKVNTTELVKDAYSYADNAPLPIIAEFAHKHGITRAYIYELAKKEFDKGNRDLTDAIKYISEQKEIKLEKGAIVGKFSPSMAIFSLKQLGWTDKAPEDKSSNEDKVVIVDDI